MYHNPGKHTWQMVDSGTNSGLPDFLRHKHLTLLPPAASHARVRSKDPEGESPVPGTGPREGQG